MPEGWDQYAVDVQAGSGTSMLGFYQRALELRRRLYGRLPDRIEWCPAPEGVLMYRRGPLVVACNFRSRPVSLEVGGQMVASSNLLTRHRRWRLTLRPNSAVWLDVSRS
jgi:alpha-glucosidase